jgi:hypothetical protein
MKIGVQGSPTFDDYNIVFLRAMRVALSSLPKDDKTFFIYSAGPKNINNFVAEFSNKTEDSLKSLGIRIRYFRIPPSWIEENINSLESFIYLSKPNESKSKLTAVADMAGIDVKWYKF